MSWTEHIFFFVLFGVIGIAGEVIFTSVYSLITKKENRSMKGHSSLWMFFIYGFVYFIILFGRTYFSGWNIFLRGLIYLFLIYCLEFASGLILKKFHAIPWIYGNDKLTKCNFRGIVCLTFVPLWYVSGILFELIYLFVKSHLVL